MCVDSSFFDLSRIAVKPFEGVGCRKQLLPTASLSQHYSTCACRTFMV